jgi:CRP-like cAMP-binding protein
MTAPAYSQVATEQCLGRCKPADCSGACRSPRVIDLEKGRAFVNEGDEVRAIYRVEAGLLRVHRVHAGGAEAVLMLLRAGDLVLNAPMFSTQGWTFSIDAVMDTRVVAYPITLAKSCSERHGAVRDVLLDAQSDYVGRLLAQVEQMKAMNATQRLATYLIALAESSGRAGRVRLPFEKRLLAQVLGMTPESLSRSIARLRGEGVAVSQDEVAIGSLDRLANFVQAEARVS